MTKTSGRILGIDYGNRRVGIAVSDPLNILARPVGVLQNDSTLLRRISEYATQFKATLIVVGMPYTLRGEKSETTKTVERFVEKLQRNSSVSVVTVDERFSSAIAHQTMLMMGTRKKDRRRKGTIDEMASAVILQAYLDRKR